MRRLVGQRLQVIVGLEERLQRAGGGVLQRVRLQRRMSERLLVRALKRCVLLLLLQLVLLLLLPMVLLEQQLLLRQLLRQL